MTEIRNAIKQCGISPKVLNSLIAGVVWFVLSKLAIQFDPIVEQAINVGIMALVAYLSNPGTVVTPAPDPHTELNG